MSTANTTLRISELDFDTIRSNLKTYLSGQAEFTDYDFEGSGMSILLDLLAYNTHYNAMQLNLVGNEMFLDTAQLRASVLSHAKMLNYVPVSRNAPQAKLNIVVTPEDDEDLTTSSLTLSRYTRFLSNPIDGRSYNFLAVNANTVSKVDGVFTFSNVVVKQGEHMTQQYVADTNNPDREFTLPTANVDTSTIRVTVQESSSNSTSWAYSLSNDITEANSNSQIYYLEENPDSIGSWKIYFGDGVVGKSLANGNIVIVDYIDTQGTAANKAGTFALVSDIGGYDNNVNITTVTSAAGGGEKQGIDSIRNRAPVWYTAQNRIVTKNDYASILLRDYPNIEAISTWGGEENDPPVYGSVYISMKPVTGYAISDEEKERIKDEIIADRAILTVFPEIVDPDYTYLLNDITVYYNPSLTTLDEAELKALVRQAVIDYKDNNLLDFNSIFRKSQLQRVVDNVDESITSCDINMFVQKRFEPTLGSSSNYELNFNIPLEKSGIVNKLYSYPEVTVEDNEGIDRNVLIEEVPDSLNGVDSITVNDTGSNYTSEPTVTITGDGSGATATAKIVNGKVTSITVNDRGANYSRATVTITGGGGSGASATAVLQATNGELRTYYFKDNGERVVVEEKIGTIDYNGGTIELINFNPTALITNSRYSNTTLTLNLRPRTETISTVRNQILTIDEDDAASIRITMIAEE